MSASAPQTSSSRARTQGRKKINDDAAYLGPSASTASTGTKRLAADKADGEPRTKRKRVETANSFKKDFEAESRRSLVSFFFFHSWWLDRRCFVGGVPQDADTCPSALPYTI